MADKKPEWLTVGEGHIDVTLSRAVKVDGVDVTALRMREPLVDDQLVYAEMTGTEAKRERTYFANLCDISPEDMGKLPLRSFVRLQAAYSLFID